MELSQKTGTEPRWPSGVAVIAIGGLIAALPSSLVAGPRWLSLAAVVVLLMMIQALISLLVIALLAGRAVNIL